MASALSAVVDAVGTVRVVPMVASGGSFLAWLAAAFLVIYPDSDDEDDDDEDEQGPSSIKSDTGSNNSTEKGGAQKSTPAIQSWNSQFEC